MRQIKAKKERLDQLVLGKGLAETIEKAQALIISANVLVNEELVDKVGTSVSVEAIIRLKSEPTRFVSRGGDKLEGAIKHFNLNLQDLVALDMGASTGGFTDCLLQHGVELVYAVDVGDNQIDYKLRTDSRVVVMEKTHAKEITLAMFPKPPNLLTVDVSFISVRSILSKLLSVLQKPFSVLILVKPQFELAREHIQEGGVVTDESMQLKAVDQVVEYGQNLGLEFCGSAPAVLKGAKKGNQEYFVYFKNNLST